MELESELLSALNFFYLVARKWPVPTVLLAEVWEIWKELRVTIGRNSAGPQVLKRLENRLAAILPMIGLDGENEDNGKA